MEQYTFELFCIDPDGLTEIKNERSFIQALSFSSKLWSEDVKNKSADGKWVLRDEPNDISLYVQAVDATQISAGFKSAFNIQIKSHNFEAAEDFRLRILEHLRDRLKVFAHPHFGR